jgi:PhnB protein
MKTPPEGYATVTPYLIVKGASAAIDYYKRVFNATERMRLGGPNDMVMHAELVIGSSVIMLADECPQMKALGPDSTGGSPVIIHLYVENVDEVYQRALDAGATAEQPLENKFYGDRSGSIRDPFGHRWSLATHIEDVSPEEMQRRMAAMMPPA